MRSQFKLIATGIPEPFQVDDTRTMHFLEAVVPNADGTNETIKFRSYAVDFSEFPLMAPQVVDAEIKLNSKDKGKTTTLEILQLAVKPA